MSEQARYITNEQGQRVGVLLDLETYDRLTQASSIDQDCLVGMNQAELQALAHSTLAPVAQSRLNELLDRNAENKLDDKELVELEQLLTQIDHLTLLKTRARYTLQSSGDLAQAS
jgi:hypothetical protein